MATTLTLAGGKVTYELDEAEAVLAGYAFGTDPTTRWKPVRGPGYGGAPGSDPAPLWPYRTYDCVPPSPGPQVSAADVVVCAGGSAEASVRLVAGVLAVADEVSEALARSPDVPFWCLREADIAHGAHTPAEDTPAWWMHRASWLLLGVDGMRPASSHKILHHKRPDLFPLLDSETRKVLASRDPWHAVWSDVTGLPAAQLTELTRRFAVLAAESGTVPLTRLRVHDVLLWCHAHRQREPAAKAGAALLV